MTLRGLNGPEGLYCAIISIAASDATGHDHVHAVDALSYFGGPQYHHHVTALGFPPETIPAALKNETTLIRVIDLVLENKYEPRQEI